MEGLGHMKFIINKSKDNLWNSQLSRHHYRPDIDGLRAVAVLSVIGFHFFPYWVKGGFVGVDIFFVISGFLISGIILNSLERNAFSFSGFYGRRIRRIFPALLVVLASCLAFGSFSLFSDEYKQLGRHVAGGAGFISNLLLWQESGYFDNAAETKPLLHLWSLGIEEQFYIIWPCLLWFIWKKRFNLATMMIALGLISFSLNIEALYHKNDSIAAFYAPQTRFWELLAGSFLACLQLHRFNGLSKLALRLDAFLGTVVYAKPPENNGAVLRDIQSLLATLFIAVSVMMLTKAHHFPGFWAVLPVLGAVLLVHAGPAAWVNRAVLSNPVLVWVGIISFPLYLWHWPLFSFARIVEGKFPPCALRMALVPIAIALAWLTYLLVEKPLRFGKGGKPKVLGLIAGMVLIGATGLGFYVRDGRTPWNEGFSKIVAAVGEWQYPGKMGSFFYEGRIFYDEKSQNGKMTLFVGDSNIEQYYVRTDELIKRSPQTRNGVIFGTGGGCLPIPQTHADGYEHCDTLMEDSLRLALSRDDISTVVVGGIWYNYFGGNHDFTSNGKKLHVIEGGEGYNLALRSLEEWIKRLTDNKKKVYLVLNIPIGSALDPKGMTKRSFDDFPHMLSVQNTDGLDYATFREKVARVKNDLIGVAKNGGAEVIDPTLSLCSGNTCKALNSNGEPIYKDVLHLRPSYVRFHADFIDKTLE